MDLVARPDDVLARAKFDLPGPGEIRQQLGDIDRPAGERTERLGQRDDALFAHRVEPDRAGRYRRRMAVLHPQDDALARRRRRQPGIPVGRPGIRVVRRGKSDVPLAAGIAEHVERVFHDVMPGRPGNVQEKLAGEVAGRESGSHIAAVDRDRGPGVAAILAPFGDDFPRNRRTASASR